MLNETEDSGGGRLRSSAGRQKVVAMSRTTSPSTGKPYGLARVCQVLEFPRSTIYAQQARQIAKVVPLHPTRRGPKPKIADADLLAAIRADLEASLFVGEGHRKVWARLRIRSGIRVSSFGVMRKQKCACLMPDACPAAWPRA